MAKAAANYSRAIAESLKKKIAASAKWIEHRASAAASRAREGQCRDESADRDAKDVENDDPEGKAVISKK